MTSFGTDAFATIQDGVDFVVDTGTVNINPGFYPEQVTLAREVTLDGTGAASDVLIDPATGHGITIIAGNVSIGDLTVQGASHGIYHTANGGDLSLRNVRLLTNGGSGVASDVHRQFTFVDVTATDNTDGASLHEPASFSDVGGSYVSNAADGIRLSGSRFGFNTNTVTLSQTAAVGNGGRGVGFDFLSQFSSTNITIIQTTSDGNGGSGVYVTGGYHLVRIDCSAVSNNGVRADTPDDLFGPFDLASDFNLIGTGDGATGIVNGVNGNQVGTSALPIEALLGPLANNGGPTATHAPLANSPAINAGDPNFDPNVFTPPLVNDQRGAGFDRVSGGIIDIGAYEVQTTNTPGVFGGDTSGTTDEDTPVSGTLTFTDAVVGAAAPNFTVSTNASNGSATIDASTGAWTYTPDADFHGSDGFVVSVTDDDGNLETNEVMITVNFANDSPNAVNDTATTDEDTPVTIDVQANDNAGPANEDPSLTTTNIVGGPAHGIVFVEVDGQIT